MALRRLVFTACDHRLQVVGGLLTGMVLLPMPAAMAADATWSSGATSGDWDTAANWLPAAVPGSAGDTASFAGSAITAISLGTATELGRITFEAGADAYTISRSERHSLILSGAGVINNSAVMQRFVVSSMDISTAAFSSFDFTNTASAGSNTEYRVEGDSGANLYGQLRFLGQSSAGAGTFIAAAGAIGGGEILFYGSASASDGNFSLEGATGAVGGTMSFRERSTAGNSVIRVWGSNAEDPTAYGGLLWFLDGSSAGNSSVYAYGGSSLNKVSGAVLLRGNATAGDATFYALGGILGGLGGYIEFRENASAGNATLVTAPMPFYQNPGLISFNDTSTGGTSSIELAGKGELIIASHAGSGITVGSLQGDDTSIVRLGTKRLTVGSNDRSTLFAGVLTGDGGELGKIGSGTLRLTASNTYSGGTRVEGGLLSVNNTAGSATGSGDVLIGNGGSLGGGGFVAGAVTVADGGHLAAGNSAGNLTLGSLLLNEGSVLDYELAAPTGTAGVDSDLITVNGDLTLDGILNVADLGGFDFGLQEGDSASYTLFTYGGSLVDNALEFGQGLLAGYNYRIDTTTSGVVSLLADFHGLQYWDGSNVVADDQIAGGSGTWNSTDSNWTNPNGSENRVWRSLIAVFDGTAGTVEVDGDQSVRGVQFAVDGYALQDTNSDGALVLADGGADIRAASDVTGVLAVMLSGSGGLSKTGAGTIVLQGNNRYLGSTVVNDGILRLVGDERIADASDLVINGGTFDLNGFSETVGSLSGPAGVIDLGASGGGGLIVNQTVDGTFAGDFTGVGSFADGTLLVKNGAATLTLSGNSLQTGTGALSISQGRLVVAGGNAIGDGYLVTGAGELELLSDETIGFLNLGTSGKVLLHDKTLTLSSPSMSASVNYGDISGTGNIVIEGEGTQLFSSANSYTGTTTINNGLLIGRHLSALGAGGALTVNSGGVLELRADLAIGSLAGNGDIRLVGSFGAMTLSTGSNNSSTTFSGLLSGEGGGLTKTGSGTLTLEGANSYSGLTTVSAGTLQVNSASGSGTGSSAVSVASGASLAGSGTLAGTVTVADGGQINAGSSSGSLTLGSLMLSNSAVLAFALADPSDNAGLGSGLLTVAADLAGGDSTGDLVLGGVLNVSDLGGFDAQGVHRLINYDGALTDNGVRLGTGFLAGYNYSVDTAAGGQVNLLVDYTGLQHWDGNGAAADGVLSGGNGNWSATGNNWSDSAGQLAAGWADLTAVFSGAAGTVEVDGQHQITGLQFVTDGYRLSDADDNALLVLADTGADLRANAGVTAIVAVALSGSSELSKTGAGTIILTGSNSYSGGTTISDGVLQGSTDSLQGDITNNAALVFDQSTDGGFSDAISGTGVLVKSGNGSLMLTASNSYAGGTQVVAGLLLGTSSSLQGDISNASEVEFVQGGDGTYAGVMSGAGSLTKSGAGMLMLSGVNSYSGGTRVLGGTLRGNALSLQGDIHNDALLEFDQQDDGLYSGIISGTGGLSKVGTGTLVLTGNNSYTGNTLVNAGKLVVNGALASSALSVDSGASVGGNGTFGSIVLNGGTLAPGNSIGTLSVAGDLDFSSGGIYAVEVDADGYSDRIEVGGVATLTNGRVQVQPEAGDYRLTTQYEILNAAGGLAGTTFDTVSSDLAFLTPTLSYSATRVSLSLRRNTSQYLSTAITGNQQALANSLDALLDSSSGGDVLINNLDVLTASGARQAFDSLSGVQHSHSSLIAMQTGRQFSGLLFDRLDRAEPGVASLPGERLDSGRGLWLRGIGRYAEVGDSTNASGMHYSAAGSALGMDGQLGDQLTLGGAFAYSQTSAGVEAGSLQLDSYQAALYGRWLADDGYQVSGALALGYHDIAASRGVQVGALAGKARSDYDAWTGNLTLEAGRTLQLSDASRLTPLVGLEYGYVERSAFSEHGAEAMDLQVEREDHSSLRSVAGARLTHSTEARNGMRIEPMLELAWLHEYLDQQVEMGAAWSAAPNGGFRVQGPALDRDRARVGAGVRLQLSSTATLDVGYRGEFAGSDAYHDVAATFRMLW